VEAATRLNFLVVKIEATETPRLPASNLFLLVGPLLNFGY
jgi:hypothetical protein